MNSFLSPSPLACILDRRLLWQRCEFCAYS